MKTLLIIAVLLLTVIVATAGNYPQPKTWEYKIEYRMNEKKANQLGGEGWELVTVGFSDKYSREDLEKQRAVDILRGESTSNSNEYIFRRPK